MRKAVFLDRDGVLIKDKGFVGDPKDVHLLPEAGSALKALHKRGYLVIVVSNQSGVARGMFSEKDVESVNKEMKRQLSVEGAHLDDIYYCPHHPEGAVETYRRNCSCRKPNPGMILEAEKEHRIDLSASYMIGDSRRDVEAGSAVGCRTVLIGSDNEGKVVAESLKEAVDKFVE